jgi:hypothetical protein
MWRILLVSIGLFVAMGCGTKRDQKGVVQGKITYKGQAVNDVTLHLYPVDGKGPDLSIPVTHEGTFSTSNIPPGEYKVVVEAPPRQQQQPRMPPKASKEVSAEDQQKIKQMQSQGQAPTVIDFPKKYSDPGRTDLKITIKEGEQPLQIDLKD